MTRNYWREQGIRENKPSDRADLTLDQPPEQWWRDECHYKLGYHGKYVGHTFFFLW